MDGESDSPRMESKPMAKRKVRRSPTRGILIAFEGIDGAGKSTQAEKLREYIAKLGYDVVLLKEPTKGRWGRQIARLAEEGRAGVKEEFNLFLRDREEDVEKNIKPALRRKQVVIMDRYYYSSVAYQGAKGLDPGLIERENLEIAPRPDMVILLDIPARTGKNRIENARRGVTDHFERNLGQVRDIFNRLANTHPEIKRIKGGPDVDTVQASIRKLVTPLLKQARKVNAEVSS
jgi:dTMP kinase